MVVICALLVHKEGDIMSLDQKTYIEKMIKDYRFEEMKTAQTPMADDFRITESNLPDRLSRSARACLRSA